jgi:hypothetical protein
MEMLRSLFWDNPVIVREFRVRMRGARAMWLLFWYLAVLSVALVALIAGWNATRHASSSSTDTSTIGIVAFEGLLIVQAFLVVFITPAITSGAITIEKEQRTLDLLQVSGIAPSAIIIGKLLSGVCFALLLTFSSVPLFALCSILGSVDLGSVLNYFLLLCAWATIAGASGLLWSAVAKNTMLAVLGSYSTVLLTGIFALFALNIQTTTPFGIAWYTLLVAVGLHPVFSSMLSLSVVGTGTFYFNTLLVVLLLSNAAVLRLNAGDVRRVFAQRLGCSLFLVWLTTNLMITWHSFTSATQSSQSVHIGAIAQPQAPLLVIILSIVIFVIAFGTSDGTLDHQVDKEQRAEGTYNRFLRWINSEQARFLHVVLTAAAVLIVYMLGHNSLSSFSLSNFLRHLVWGSSISAVTQHGIGATPYTPFVLMAIMMFAVGFTLFCNLLSQITRMRWIAVVLSVLWLLTDTIVPLNSYAATGPSKVLLYLNPFAMTFYLFQRSIYGVAGMLPSGINVATTICKSWLVVSVFEIAAIVALRKVSARRSKDGNEE